MTADGTWSTGARSSGMEERASSSTSGRTTTSSRTTGSPTTPSAASSSSGATTTFVAQNSITGNGDPGSDPDGGIHVFAAPDDARLASDRNSFTGNDLRANIPDGILVDAGQGKTLLG